MSDKQIINSKQLDKDLDKSNIERVYLFLGEEDGVKDKIIAKIKEKISNKNRNIGAVLQRFHLENGEFMNAADYALSQSLFSESKICVMLNIDSIQPLSSNLQLMDELIGNLPDKNTLIMTSSENNQPKIINAKIANKIRIVRFWRFFENDAVNYIKINLGRIGVVIDERAIHLMIELLGRDIRKIDGALEKISLSGEKRITEDYINQIILFERDVSIFDYIDALFKKEKKAFTLLRGMIDSGMHELIILNMITRQVDMLERYHQLIGDTSLDTIMKELKISDRNRVPFLQYAGKFTSQNIKMIYPFILRAESKIKGEVY